MNGLHLRTRQWSARRNRTHPRGSARELNEWDGNLRACPISHFISYEAASVSEFSLGIHGSEVGILDLDPGEPTAALLTSRSRISKRNIGRSSVSNWGCYEGRSASTQADSRPISEIPGPVLSITSLRRRMSPGFSKNVPIEAGRWKPTVARQPTGDHRARAAERAVPANAAAAWRLCPSDG